MRLRRRLLAVLPLLAPLVVLTAAQARTATDDPIVGLWSFSGGVVKVDGAGTAFTGVVVKETRFSNCPHPVGEVMWRITGSGGTYTGTHLGFASLSTCTREEQQATWTTSGNALLFRVGNDSYTLARAVIAPPKFRWAVSVKAKADREPTRSYMRSDARGNGTFQTTQLVSSTFVRITNATGGVAFVHRFVGRNETVAIRTTGGGEALVVGARKKADLTGVVTAGCRPGSPASLHLEDHSEAADRDSVTVRACGRTLTFSALTGVSVIIAST